MTTATTALTIVDATLEDKLEAFRKTYAPNLTNAELMVFGEACQRLGLDPFARHIFVTKTQQGLQIMVSIDGLRSIAERSQHYGGPLGPFWCGPDGQWHDVWLKSEAPTAAKYGVVRTGWNQPVWGVARFKSYDQGRGNWVKMPDVMLAVRAEAQALRRAFPQLAGVYTPGEMDLDEEPATPFVTPADSALDPNTHQDHGQDHGQDRLDSTAQFRAAIEEMGPEEDAEPEPAKPVRQERSAAPVTHSAPKTERPAGPDLTIREFVTAVGDEFQLDAGAAMKHLGVRSLQGLNLRDALATLRTHLAKMKSEGKATNAMDSAELNVGGGDATRRYFAELAEKAGYSPQLARDEYRRVAGDVPPTVETRAIWEAHLKERIAAKAKVEAGLAGPDAIDVDGPVEPEELEEAAGAIADATGLELVEVTTEDGQTLHRPADDAADVPNNLRTLDTSKRRGKAAGRLN